MAKSTIVEEKISFYVSEMQMRSFPPISGMDAAAIQSSDRLSLVCFCSSQVPQPTCENGLGFQYPQMWEILK